MIARQESLSAALAADKACIVSAAKTTTDVLAADATDVFSAAKPTVVFVQQNASLPMQTTLGNGSQREMAPGAAH